MDLILFFFYLAKGAAFIGTAFTIAIALDIIAGIINGIQITPYSWIAIPIDIILFFVFRHFGYPIKPMMWTFLVFSAISCNPVMLVLNIIGIILSFVFLF